MALVGSLILLSFSLVSCHRNRREVWEDTKTCSRYVNKGLRSLLGSHSDPYAHAYTYNLPEEDEFLVIADNESYEGTFLSEFADESRENYPLSQISPGDPGCPIPGLDGFHAPNGKLAELFAALHFETDKYEITGRDNLEAIQAIARHLCDNKDLHIFVEGHADERGTAAYNLALGSRRANSIRSYLIQNGVSPDQLFTISFGKERPIVFGHDEGSWRKNRRAEFKLYER